MKDLQIILYQHNVKDHAMLRSLLQSESSIHVQHISPLSLIEQLPVEKYDGILYECDTITYRNREELRLLEKTRIPYYILSYHVEEGILNQELKNHYIQKPEKVTAVFRNQLLLKVCLMHNVKPVKEYSMHHRVSTGVIGIASSTGGPHALRVILEALPVTTNGIVIVQHMIEENIQGFAEYLSEHCELRVKVAQGGDLIYTGVVYIAKQKQHLRVVREQDGYYIQYQKGEKINCVCPSADVLFTSMAEIATPDMVGIILTGMGKDGAKGLKALKDAGGYAIIQDKATSQIYGMPKEAKRLNAYHIELALEDISGYLIQHNLNQHKEKGNLL